MTTENEKSSLGALCIVARGTFSKLVHEVQASFDFVLRHFALRSLHTYSVYFVLYSNLRVHSYKRFDCKYKFGFSS